MLNEITFKTELNEILTIEEVALLFDTLKKNYNLEMISLGLYPQYNKLRKKIIKQAITQRNAELSKLLNEIHKRKQEIKINIWKTLSKIEDNKRNLNNTPDKEKNIEQILYEAEQIINVYEKSLAMLERKEIKIMNGKYPRINKISSYNNKKVLKRQLEDLAKKILKISIQHDNCFNDYIEELEDLSSKTVLTNDSFPIKYPNKILEEHISIQNIIIEKDTINHDEKQQKDFYQYEPNQNNLDDELIFQLLSQGKYEGAIGTINGLILPNIFIDCEEN